MGGGEGAAPMGVCAALSLPLAEAEGAGEEPGAGGGPKVAFGDAVVDGDGDALLVESPVPEGMSAVAVVAHAVAASTAATVEQASSTRVWEAIMKALEQARGHSRNGERHS